VLVLGASMGIGRASSLAIAAQGARVALAARRPDVLAAAVKDAGPGCIGIECDVSKPGDCARVVERAVAAFGGLDALVYSPGITLMERIEDFDAAAWRATFDTNVIGAMLVTRAALPHLLATRGKVVFFSSIVIDDSPPRFGLAPYAASKAALESLAAAWRGEHPTIGFTTLAIGDTASEKVEIADAQRVAGFIARWTAPGVAPQRLMEAESVAEQVVNVLASRETVRRLAITPTPP